MDPLVLKSIETRVKELELKMQAVLDVLQLRLEYQPEQYKLVQPEESEENE